VTVGTVRFTVLAGSGSTTVSLASSSLIVHPTVIPGTPPTTGAEDVWNHALVGASYSFTTPAPVQPIQPNTGGSNSNLSSPAGNTNKTPSASKTTTSGANNATNQTTSTDAAKTSGDDTSVLGTEKNNTPASYVASLQKNAASNPVWLIVIAILVVLAGAAAIYARRNPRQFAAATSAAALAAGSAKNATLSVFKKAEAKPVAKKSATKAVIAKKPATKKKATAKKTPVKKAKVPKKS